MRKALYLLMLPLLLSGCSSEDDKDEELGKDLYYVQYTAAYCDYDSHHIRYRDVDGNLVSQTIKTSEVQKFEIGPVSPTFQAYIEGNTCIYMNTSISIFVRKNNQDYIQMATQSVRSNYADQTVSLTFNLREYD